MSDKMPDEIWARPDTHEGVWALQKGGYASETCYIRADLYEAVCKDLERAHDALNEYANADKQDGLDAIEKKLRWIAERGHCPVSMGLAEDALSELFKIREALTWQPIETAPRDGTDIYATRVDAVVFRPSVIYFENYENRGWLCSQTHRAVNSQPTHWMPLPQPPKGNSDDR